ncbi:MAG: hypothetical protein M3Q47_15515 [Actinomycetota bacterium]|nr:hypothetical protein [Actinomycetota bacterium]
MTEQRPSDDRADRTNTPAGAPDTDAMDGEAGSQRLASADADAEDALTPGSTGDQVEADTEAAGDITTRLASGD